MTWLGWYIGFTVITFVLQLLSMRRLLEDATWEIKGKPTKQQAFELIALVLVTMLGKAILWPLSLPLEVYLVVVRGVRPPKLDVDYGEHELEAPPVEQYHEDMARLSYSLQMFLQRCGEREKDQLGRAVDSVVYCDTLLLLAHHAFTTAQRQQFGKEIERIESFGARASGLARAHENERKRRQTYTLRGASTAKGPDEEERKGEEGQVH